ncbi:PREDICTED: leucine-twenty homeobox [Ceratotherium simum simum]|uniref:Leucine-twenty homeobox n=1 Tax=Ceratotherium simum simum TaxID=73337 RepID=A0ABM0I6U7_CERSS|nr:PREDICTED: leucine-twenty homeobox [Ceratotherium simum simum]
MYPDWATIMELTSMIHLEESVIKTWFKNQRVKRRKQQQQTRPSPSPEAPNQTTSVKEQETLLPVTSANTDPTSPSISDDCEHEPPKPSGIQQPGGAGASVWNSWDSQSHDLQQICLGLSDPPWASVPYDMDEFIRLYTLPGDDDPSSLDWYLFPKCPN